MDVLSTDALDGKLILLDTSVFFGQNAFVQGNNVLSAQRSNLSNAKRIKLISGATDELNDFYEAIKHRSISTTSCIMHEINMQLGDINRRISKFKRKDSNNVLQSKLQEYYTLANRVKTGIRVVSLDNGQSGLIAVISDLANKIAESSSIHEFNVLRNSSKVDRKLFSAALYYSVFEKKPVALLSNDKHIDGLYDSFSNIFKHKSCQVPFLESFLTNLNIYFVQGSSNLCKLPLNFIKIPRDELARFKDGIEILCKYYSDSKKKSLISAK